MEDTHKYMVPTDMGCGLLEAIFHLGGLKTRKSLSPPPLPPMEIVNSELQQGKMSILEFSKLSKPPSKPSRKITLPSSKHKNSHNQIQSNRPSYTKPPKVHMVKFEEENIVRNSKTIQNKDNSGFVMGNIMRRPNVNNGCGIVNKLDPDVLKNMGNEKYKQGKFEAAFGLYSPAILGDSRKASFYSNRSAALIGLGRLLEAVFDCRIAIKIQPSYYRAHYRLANLYLRLGEAEKALCHYKQSGPIVDTKDIAKAQALMIQVNRCNIARKLDAWETLLKDTQIALSSGADSAPQIYAMQAEALMKLHRHEEADSTIQKAPNFDINYSNEFFGSSGSAKLQIIRAQVYMAAGRFEEAVSAANCASRLDSSDDVNRVVKTTRAMASARTNGNQLFKASRFSEACLIYSKGLEHEPYNSVILCNRAACWSKLDRLEKALEDCNVALILRPSYSKARLRRADCNARLQRWEAAVKDYVVLTHETPGDEDLERALYQAQIHLNRQCTEGIKISKSDSSF